MNFITRKKIIACCFFGIAAVSATTSFNTQAGNLSYGMWDKSQLAATKTIITEFEKQNPSIKVNVELIPFKQYWVKTEAATSGGVAPDVMWMNMVNIQLYARHNNLVQLDSYIAASKLKLADYVPSSVQAFNDQGKQYGIPRDVDSVAVWYNKKIFDAASVAYPTNNWTWDQMIDSAKKIKAYSDKTKTKIYPIFMDLLNNGQESFYNVIPSNGGYIINKDKTKIGLAEPAAVDALKRIQAMMAGGLLPNATELSGMVGSDLFQSGKVAMFYGGAWWVKPLTENPAINKTIGVVEMPALKQKSAVVHSIAHVISQSSKNKDEAWKLVDFMSGQWAQSVLAQTGTVIPAKLSAQAAWAKHFSIDTSPYITAFNYSTTYPFSLYSAKWEKAMGDGLLKVWTGEDVQKAMDKTTQSVDRMLAAEKK